jgi:hypothetical protein
MVVPVPIVLQKENVKTLTDEIFDKLDKLAAPRLVEYWEQDPCAERAKEELEKSVPAPVAAAMAAPPSGGAGLGVKIEAQFKVGEYEIVILSAQDSTGLDTWLRQSGYKIPEGAEPLLRPYVQSGSKFFVAKVDVQKVRFDDKGMAKLSPLRFHYDAEQFNLPVRLGLINSGGTQDLIVHILARGQRYELANYKNVTIPTNLDVDEKARDQFGALYAALFDRTIEKNPGAVVTEYAWDAGSCDPCPGPTLDFSDITTLGGDVLPDAQTQTPPPVPGGPAPAPMVMPPPSWGGNVVLTRLHARYGRDSLGEDLVFRVAEPIQGGREFPGPDGKLETGAQKGYMNNFQGRYAIRHSWKGPIACSNPIRGIWGGPPGGEQAAGGGGVKAAQNLAFAPRGALELASMVRHDVPEIGLQAASASASNAPPVPHAGAVEPLPPSSRGCGACAVGEGSGRGAFFAAMGGLAAALGWLARRRRG